MTAPDRETLAAAVEAALFYDDTSGNRVFAHADRRVVVGQDAYIDKAVPAVVDALLAGPLAPATPPLNDASWIGALHMLARAIRRGGHLGD